MEDSESKITDLFIATMLRYFLTVACVALFVFLGNCEFKRKSS